VASFAVTLAVLGFFQPREIGRLRSLGSMLLNPAALRSKLAQRDTAEGEDRGGN